MNDKEIENLNEILTKLQDIKNSQESVVEKIGQVQVDLFNTPDKNLEGKLDEYLTNSSNSYEFIKNLTEAFEQKINSSK